MYDLFPQGTSLYLLNVSPIFRAKEANNKTVCPQAAFISDQGTGTVGSLPNLRPLIVPK